MATASRPILTGKSRLGAEWRQYEAIFPALATSRIDQVSVECAGAKVPLDLLGLLNGKEVLLMRSEVGLASVRSSLGEQPPLRREGISGSHKTPRWREMDFELLVPRRRVVDFGDPPTIPEFVRLSAGGRRIQTFGPRKGAS